MLLFSLGGTTVVVVVFVVVVLSVAFTPSLEMKFILKKTKNEQNHCSSTLETWSIAAAVYKTLTVATLENGLGHLDFEQHVCY